MPKNNSIDINKYNIKLTENNKLSLYGLIFVSLIGLLFRTKLNINIEKIFLFITILSLLLVLTKNWVISLVVSVILFLIFNLLLNAQLKSKYIESFDNSEPEKTKEDKIKSDLENKSEEIKKKLDSSEFINNLTEKMKEYQNNKDVKKGSDGLQELLSQLDGGIEIKKNDKEERGKLDVDSEDFKDDKKKFDPMEKAQKDTYELINMVDNLKNTMETLAPVLSQGKEIMNMFENFKM
jgi:hypothetical protein